MYKLIDIKNGLVFHCETLRSAFSLRTTICKGIIYRDGQHITESAIKMARATWEKGGQQ